MYYAHSITFSKDLQMYNQYSLMPGSLGVIQINEKGYGNNVFPIGHSLVYMPFLLNSNFVESVLFNSGVQQERPGYSHTTYFNYLLLSFILCLLSNIIIYFILNTFFKSIISLLATLFIFFGTVIFGYSYLITSYSHTAVLFFVSLLVLLLTKENICSGYKFYIYSIISGVLIIIRYDAAIYLLLPLYDFIRNKVYKKPGLMLKCTILFAITISPQVLAYIVLYGKLSFSPSENLGNLIIGISQNLYLFFIHPNSGILTLTPLTLLAMTGFFTGLRKTSYSFLFLIIMVMEYLQMSLRVDLIAGNIYGMRRFFPSMCFLAFGLAFLFQSMQKHGKIYYILSVCISCILSLHYFFRLTLIEIRHINYDHQLLGGILSNIFILPSIDGLKIMLRRGFLYRAIMTYSKPDIAPGIIFSIILYISFASFIYFAYKKFSRQTLINIVLIAIIIYTGIINLIIIKSDLGSELYSLVTIDESAYKGIGPGQAQGDGRAKGLKTPFDLFISQNRNKVKLTDISKFWGEKFHFGFNIIDNNYTRSFESLEAKGLSIVFCTKTCRDDLRESLQSLKGFVEGLKIKLDHQGYEYDIFYDHK